MVEKFMVEIFRVERFMIEKSGVEKFMVEKSGVEMSFNLSYVIIIGCKPN